jgi:chemotaxis signal transduction protein
MRKRIDWTAVKKRLNDIQTQHCDSAQLKSILKQRSVQLAKRKDEGNLEDAELYLLTFCLGAERYAIDLTELSEVVSLAQLTQVPGSAAELFGIINVRGEIVPVVDIAHIIGLPKTATDVKGYVLLLHHAKCEVGLVVEQIGEVRALKKQEVADMNRNQSGPSNFVQGVIKDGTAVLNLESVFTHSIFNTH